MTAITSLSATVLTTERLFRVVAVFALATAGAIHLALTPGHLALSPALAFGFLAAGLTQVALAVALTRYARRRLLMMAAATSALFIAVYVYDVMVGLPMVTHAALHIETHSHAADATVHDTAGAIDPGALAAKSAEAVTLISCGVLLARTGRRTRNMELASTYPSGPRSARTPGGL